jgi:hypothetical protein
MKIKTILSRLGALFGLAVLALAACASDTPPSRGQAGLWESTYRGPNGEANSIVMNSDSVVDRYFLKALDYRFSTFGDSLSIQPLVPDSLLPAGDTVAPVFKLHYAVEGDTLIRTGGHRTEWLARVGPPPGNPYAIVGTWKIVRSTDVLTVNGFQRYRPDFVLEVRLPVSVKHGVYEIQGDSLWLTFNDGESSRCAMSLHGDSLALTRTYVNGPFTFEYVRRSTDLWYPLEEF